VAYVFGGVGDLLPQLIDSRPELSAVALSLLSQFLNGSCHRVTLLDFLQDEHPLFRIVPRPNAGTCLAPAKPWMARDTLRPLSKLRLVSRKLSTVH
jgi:hypothetical protein